MVRLHVALLSMRNTQTAVILLRILHGCIALYFVLCLLYIYYCAIVKTANAFLWIAVVSVLVEGILLYFFNNGDCILIHVQRKIGDNTPFFNLFLPEKIAKRAIPFFAILTLVGLVFLVVRI